MKRILFAILLLATCASGQTSTVTWGTTYQAISGFGASNHDQGSAMTAAQANFLFNTSTGLGYSILRIGTPEGGQCTSAGSSCAQGGDFTSDMSYCVANGCGVYITSWTPPASMKSNNNIACSAGAGSGTLNTSSYQAFSNYIANYISSLISTGVLSIANLLGTSVQNEPEQCESYDSSLLSNSQFDALISANFGATIQSGTAMPEVSGYDDFTTYAGTCMGDANCSKYVTINTYHGYDSGSSPSGGYGTSSYGKQMWETETSSGPGYGPYADCGQGIWCPDISDAMMWATIMDDALAVANNNAWLFWWWNNQNGDNEGLIYNGVVSLRSYVIANYSRWVRPGWVRMSATHAPQSNVTISAYQQTSSGQFAIIATNYSTSPITQAFSLSGFPGSVTSLVPYVTTASCSSSISSPASCPAQGSTVTVSGTSASYVMPAQSVTTLVGTTGSSPGPLANVYVAQAATGGGGGGNCGNALIYSWLNSSGNYGTGANQYGPGTTINICGKITGNGSFPIIALQGPGVAGNPIILSIPPGTSVSAPNCGSSDCLSLSNYVSMTGGPNPCGVTAQVITSCAQSDGNGVVELTSNGSGLATQYCGTQLIYLASHDEVKNLVIRNAFQRFGYNDNLVCTENSMNALSGGDADAIALSSGTGNSVHDNVIHMVGTGHLTSSCPNTADSFFNNYVYSYNWGFQSGVGSPCVSQPTVYGNVFGSPKIFDDVADHNHHNGIFLYNNSAASGSFNTCNLYNNTFSGDTGLNSTGRIFFGGGQETCTIFNNRVLDDGNPNPEDNAPFVLGAEATGAPSVYNNTVWGNSSTNAASCIQVQGHFTVENNIATNCSAVLYVQDGVYSTGAPTLVALDYNPYGAGSASIGSGIWQYDGVTSGSTNTIAAWRTLVQAIVAGSEAHSSYTSGGVTLNSDGTLPAGSSAIAAGKVLYSLCNGQPNPGLGALCFDFNGTARPTSGTWDAGAFVSGATAAVFSVSPSSLTFSPQPLGTTSVAQTLTLSNTGTATGSISSIAMNAGTNFSETNTCSSTLAAGSSCPISVKFAPTVTGAQSDQVDFTTTPATMAVAVSGTGTSPSSIVQTNSTTCAPPASPSTTLTCTIPSTTANTANVVGYMSSNTYGTTPITGVTDNAPGGSSLYQHVSGSQSVNTAQNTLADIWFAPSVKAGATQVTLTFGAPSSGTITDAQVTNINVVDIAAVINNGPATLTPAGASVTASNASEYIISLLDPFGDTTGVGNGFTLDATTFGNGVAHQIVSSTGAYNSTWTVATSGQFNNSTATFYQAAAAPIVSPMPAALTFGSVGLGTTTSPQTVTVTNNGTANLVISSISISGQFNLGVDSCNLMPSTIAPGASCTISATFSPTTLGTQAGNITIVSNAATATIPLSGMGISVAPAVSLSPATFTFPNTRLGTFSATQTTVLTNTGTATLNISSITTTGQYSNTTTCGSTLAMSASCNIVVTFSPTSLGAQSGTVRVLSNAASSPNLVSLTGTGVASGASLSTNTLAFGNQPITTTSGTQNVVVTNNGSATLTVSAVALTTGTQFAISTDNCISGSPIAIGSTCTIALTFTPTTTGAKTDTLTITTNVPSSPTVALTGTGTTQPQPGVGLSTNALLFPYVLINGTATLPLVVTNTGNANLTFGAGSITVSDTTSGDPANVWSETDNCISGSPIAASASCTIEITLSPTTVGSKTGTISIVTNAASSPNSATMTGTAVTQTSGPSAPNGSIPVP